MPKPESGELSPRQLSDRRYREANKAKIAAYRAAYREAHREKYKASNAAAKARYAATDRGKYMKRTSMRAKRYGLTREQVAALMAEPCQICGGKATDVDHCHTTGAVRGGLCHPCNVGISLFNDNPTTLRAAALYLERTE